MNYPGVASAKAVGRARGIGTVDVYVTMESGVPTAELLGGLQAELQEKREISVDVQVKTPTISSVDVSVEIETAAGQDFATVKAAVEQAITAFFNGQMLGRPVRLAELGNRIYALDGVDNYHFSAPTADVAAEATVLPVLGTLSIVAMEA